MKFPRDPLRFIRTVHRHARWRPLVWALAFTVLGFGSVRADTLGWWPDGYLAGLGAACVAAAILVNWLKRERTLTAPATARGLDARWQLQARIETTWELAESKTELAEQQRQDAARHLAGRREPWAIMWHLGVAMLTLSVLLLATVTLVGPKPPPFVAGQHTPEAPTPTSKTKAEPNTGEVRPKSDSGVKKEPPDETPPPVEPEKPEDTFAEIAWLVPTSAIKATAIEEITLAADVVTRSGFAKLTFEVTVNGEPRPSPALPPEVLAALTAPTETRVDFPLHLDELELKPFDVVGYFLRAEPVARRPVPAVVSPIQFIEIKPLERGEDQARETPPQDPFRDRKSPTLPERKTTPAGQLEELAKKQSELAQQIGRAGESGRDRSDRSARETARASEAAALVEPQGLVAYQAGRLAKSKKLADETKPSIEQAAREATAAVEGLAKNDVAQALPRASEAAQRLQEAVFQQERAGRALAVAILEDARRRFNAAARAATAEERARQIGEAIDRLANAALEQQESGSGKAAAELAEVARAYQVAWQELRSLKNQAAAKEPSEPAAWQAAELRAAQAQLVLSSEREMLGLTLRQLQRAKHLLPLTRRAVGADITEDNAWKRAIEDTELALQMAQVFITHQGSIPARGIRRILGQAISDFYRNKYIVAAPEFEAALNSLEALLAEAPVENKRDERVRAFNPDEIDPEYRAPVENYFEQLSGKKPRK